MDMAGTINSVAVIAATALVGLIVALPRVVQHRGWRAMMTPLASIIGSGFLVLGPILLHAYGSFAPLAMAALCLLAYGFGAAIRFNIAQAEPLLPKSPVLAGMEQVSEVLLAFAYVISVAYYLNLFGAFAVSLTQANDQTSARIVTSAALAFVATIGVTRGFSGLERAEQTTVAIKLAVIAGLLMGFVLYFGERATGGELVLTPPELSLWPALTLGFGLVITVQGFETSRYLGRDYDAPMRIWSMRRAQWLSSAIYMAYVTLIAFVFVPADFAISETAIIDLTHSVAPVLPGLLVLAALAAQASAAIADTSGAGGLTHELTAGRIRPALAYVILAALGLALTWAIDVFAIIALASRAFAAYYMFQALIAYMTASAQRRPLRVQLGWLALAAIGAAIVILGTPAEG